jgi:hypothetical protein
MWKKMAKRTDRNRHERRANGNQNLQDSTHCWELLNAPTALVVYYN